MMAGAALAADAPPVWKTGVPVTLDTDEQKMSYSIGVQIGAGLKGDAVDLDLGLIMRGMRDVIEEAELAMPRDDTREWMGRFQQAVMAYRRDVAKREAESGRAWLEENAAKEGVVELPSGLQYKVLKEGSGATPGPDDRVKVNYRGTLLNGDEFDSSYGRGEPAVFRVSGVVEGWQEALQLMKEGAKWQLFVPPDLAYGERGFGSNIGPNAVLIFEIELLEVVRG